MQSTYCPAAVWLDALPYGAFEPPDPAIVDAENDTVSMAKIASSLFITFPQMDLIVTHLTLRDKVKYEQERIKIKNKR